MLNQFYNYLSSKLKDFFKNQSLKGGERFYLQFDDESQVEHFYQVLSKQEEAETFTYQHKQGSPYHTFCLEIDEVRVVVAATVDYVTPDFLVTLRNKVGEQSEGWKNTALLSICHETLDSIRGGSSDLQKEGMPFHPKSITKTLKQEIEASELTKVEKEVANFHLRKQLEDMVLQPALSDFAEVLGFLSQGSIRMEDYPSLGLFYDKSLNQYKPSQIQKRLEENHDFFEKIQHIHEYENLNQQLEKTFDDKGVSRLKKDDWQQIDYSFVKESNERLRIEDKKALEYIESVDKQTEEGIVYWEKPFRETKAGQRKRHLIVFNFEKIPEINLTFEFDEFLKKEYIAKKSQNFAAVSGKKLKLSLSHNVGETTFYKVTYEHKKENKSTYDFHIAIVESNPEFLKSIQTLYEVKENEKRLVVHNNGDNVLIGDKDGAEERYIEEQEETIELLTENEGVAISAASPAWSDDSLSFLIKLKDFSIPFKIKDQVSKATPVSGKQIWKLKREKQGHFLYNNGKLQLGTLENHPREEFKTFLAMEEEWIQQGMIFAGNSTAGLESKTLNLPTSLEESYRQLMEYYQTHRLLPSLAYLDDELELLSKSYVNAFKSCIQDIEQNSIMTDAEKNMLKIGTIEESKRILFTPLHPLNIAYQLAVQERLKRESVEQHMLNRLRPNNLLPYLYGEQDVLYRPVIQHDASEWVIYEPLKQVTVGESNAYLANVVEEKLQQFVEHFSYLFLSGAKSPLKVNVINITNDKEVLRGLVTFIKRRIDKYGPQKTIPLHVALYGEVDSLSAFEEFSIYNDVDSIEEKFGVSLASKDLDLVDVLRIVRENIHYYKLEDDENYDYAHISFYKMISQDSHAKDNMEEIETGLSLNGLLSSVTSMTDRKDYRTGFGIKNVLDKQNELIETSYLINELAGNLQNQGSNPYRKQESIVTRTTSMKEATLDSLYDASSWVTFIDPNVDLDFFQRSKRELLIIHYSDQYTSSSQFDAITVTDKSLQYRNVIKQYLDEEYVQAKDEQIDAAIRAFNAINGEWLLRIIGSKGQFSREKLSIISAIKYAMSFLEDENILWVPISLEEILRVAGVVKLTKSEGIFSAKNLGVKGATSDDLLMIGLEVKWDGEVYLHYYPVEVKVGLNQVSTIVKAKEQIATTRKLLDSQLQKEDEDGKALFKSAFFRNFFVQMFLANAHKFIANGLWPEKSFDAIEKVKAKLLNDDYQVGYHLRPYIGSGMVLSFKNEAAWRSARKEDGALILELAEEDAYSGVIEEIDTIKKRIHQGETDISTDLLLANSYGNSSRVNKHAQTEEKEVMDKDTEDKKEDSKPKDSKREDEKKHGELKPAKDNTSTWNLENIRVLLGTVEGSTQKIYWEYGHRELANRHILISGKSGQGKTYFMQCLLMELAANNISSIIFDYTGGFKKSKLEPEFREFLGDSLDQILVARDNFPINPFKRNEKELDEDEYILEDFSDVADRMKSVFAAIYKDLGIQQLNAIYQAIMRGLRKYGDEMNLEMLRAELQEDTSGPAKTALSQLNPMIDKNPFDKSHEFNWGNLEKDKGKVIVIQLTGFASDVQKMITEFILWDLWHYKLQYGDQRIPVPVILDEAQNLDHSEKSPSAKILTEGRKFGWSGWYATQFLKGLLSTDEVARLQNSSQKVYFLPPENELTTIASNLAHDTVSKKEWEKRLSLLNKGQCISYGPTQGRDGSLKQSEPIIVNISSLSERIDQLNEKAGQRQINTEN